MSTGVKLRDVGKVYGTTRVIQGLDLDIEPGEFCVFVGPSGCGKSTILRMIAGLETATEGSIHIGERDVTNVDPARRGVAMVFQNYALYPHMSVAENMGFSLRMAKRPKLEIAARVAEVAKLLQIEEYLERRPADLSGGQRQRVAIGRALVRDPDVFLFDEPLSNLDAALRGQTRVEIARLHGNLDTTMIYVTHDQVEAMTLADRIVVFEGGRVMQVGRPMDLYNEPANLFVAGFLGSPGMNFMPQPDGTTLGMRPEDIVLGGYDVSRIRGIVGVVERLGGQSLAHITLEDGNVLIYQCSGDTDLVDGSKVGIDIHRSRMHRFDRDGERVGEGAA